jgi:hypothetical protein
MEERHTKTEGQRERERKSNVKRKIDSESKQVNTIAYRLK